MTRRPIDVGELLNLVRIQSLPYDHIDGVTHAGETRDETTKGAAPMRIDRVVFAFLVGLAGCLTEASTVAPDRMVVHDNPASTTAAEPLASTQTAPVSPGSVESWCAVICNEVNECPSCFGQVGSCGADGVCSYSGGGGGGGGGGPGCDARFCSDASECASACPSSFDPQCNGGVCQY